MAELCKSFFEDQKNVRLKPLDAGHLCVWMVSTVYRTVSYGLYILPRAREKLALRWLHYFRFNLVAVRYLDCTIQYGTCCLNALEKVGSSFFA